MIRGIYLDVADPDGVRDLLRMAGLVGPWCASPGDDVLSIIEQHGVTWIIAGDPAQVLEPLRPAVGATVAMPATVVGSRSFNRSHTLLFPLYRHDLHALDPTCCPTCDRLWIVRENGATAAMRFAHQRVPGLVLGLSLSALTQAARSQFEFYGYGHVVFTLRWWLAQTQLPIILLDPWQLGRLPCLLSFDVEGMVARRSVGRTVFRLPPAQRPLLEVNRLDLIRPLRSKRYIRSANVLHDPDGSFTSRRFTVDTRRAAVGCADERQTVTQWQIHLRLPRCPDPHPTNDPDFHNWLYQLGADGASDATAYYCGGLPDVADARDEIGFHGLTHDHFHHMTKAELMHELQLGNEMLGHSRTHRMIRAPGLLWSHAYFAALEQAGFSADSSFREINAFQPIVPIRTAAGWWQLPVTGNVLTAQPYDALLTTATQSHTMLNLHCHDHEVRDEHSRTAYHERVQQSQAAGFQPMGHASLLTWLEQSRCNEIIAVEPRAEGQFRVEIDAINGTMLHLPPESVCSESSHVAGISDHTRCSVMVGSDRRTIDFQYAGPTNHVSES